MDFELSGEQCELERAAHDLLARVAGKPPDEAWDAVTAQGWLGVLVPEEVGGLGLTWVEACVLLEQLGGVGSGLPVAPTILAIDATVRARQADALVDGEACAFVVATERHPLRASSDGKAWTISGESAPALHVPDAQHLLCTTRDGVFLIAGGDGVSVEPVACVDPTRSLGRATFRAAPARRVGGPDEVARVIDRASLAASADMLGSARHALELATAYAKDRVQFGQPIGSFQAVKHRLADMLVDVEAMNSLTYWAAWCLSHEEPEGRIAAASARWCARECGPRVLAGALQVHGGIGFTWEHELHRYIKRTSINSLPIGGRTPYEPDLSRLLVQAYRAGADAI